MKVCVVIPNLNGRKRLVKCLDPITAQLGAEHIILVDNGSTDGSTDFVESNYPGVRIVRHERNLGFAGGVNSGIRLGLTGDYDAVALLNNDAAVQRDWLKNLIDTLKKHPEAGIVTSKILDGSAGRFDSTGELYSVWGLPFPRGRGEADHGQYDQQREIFGASGGASLYRATMLKSVGLFDNDFFAYYEDVDLSFRARLAGWQVLFEPTAVVHHEIGQTSGRIPGFTTYQTLKNLPMLYWKNMPLSLLLGTFPRFVVAYSSIYLSALGRGQFGPATKGLLMSLVLWPKKLVQRIRVQSRKKVDDRLVSSWLVHDLPPGAARLRRLRHITTLGRLA
ncbi:MAG TPA: glycosyltransferase family 2 protein [Candidatus Saccharimonadales bacterium]|nr:glycosyltransferase family 2 protein [Candidatus Saccharimonadales bacterium]